MYQWFCRGDACVAHWSMPEEKQFLIVIVILIVIER